MEMTATVPNKDAWTRARDRYVEDLTEAEKAIFNKASIKDILYDASAAEKRHAASSQSRTLSKKLEPFFSAIEQYGEAMDVYVNAYPLALSPIWGSIRVILHLASEYGKYFDKLVGMFASIGDVLPRFETYEKLFPNHEFLAQSLSKVYLDIIEFCTDAKKIFRDAKRLTGLKAALGLTWKPFERQFGDQLEGFRQHRKNVEKEAGLAHMIEAADSRALVLANKMQMEKDRRLDERRQLLKKLSTVDYEAKHQKIKEARYEGTGDWLLNDETYLSWKEADASACLCCTGIPGSGKTFLASRVIEDCLGASSLTNPHVFHYYCDYADVKTIKAEHVLEAFLKQLLLKSVVPKNIECRLKRTYVDEMRSEGAGPLREYICSTIAASSGIYVVVDGLDECEPDSRQDVMTLLERLINLGQPIVKVLVSCREDDQILTCFEAFPRIQLSQSILAPDMEAFITGSVSMRIRKRRLKLKDPTLEHDIVSELIAKAQGMFLWVHFQLEELCDASSDTHIREILQNLPRGLEETYNRILEKLGRLKNKYPPKVFRWIACAQRPLQLCELQEAVSHEVSDRCWHDAADIDGDRLIRSCGALISIDEDDRTVRFAHHTVLQFLLLPGEIPLYHFSLAEANRQVGEMCVVYLCFSDFETAIHRRLPDLSIVNAPLFKEGGVAGISSSLGMSKLVSNTVRLFHTKTTENQTECVDIDYKRYMGSSQKSTEPVVATLAKKCLLLEYVVANWDWHTKWLEDSNKVIWNSFRRLVLQKELAFDFRKWGVNNHYGGSYGCIACNADTSKTYTGHLPFVSLINYALSVGHVPMLRLIEDGPDSTAHLSEYLRHEGRYNVLRLACNNTRENCLRYLSDYYPADYSPVIVIRNAIILGQEALVPIILGEYSEIFQHWDGRPALRSAIKRGRSVILESLLDKGVPFNMETRKDEASMGVAFREDHNAVVATLMRKGLLSKHHLVEHGYNLLVSAAANGNRLLVQALIQGGESVDCYTEKRGKLTFALHEAAVSGHSDVIEVLLNNNASIEVGSVDGMTALFLAVLFHKLDAVRTLCQRGANVHVRQRDTSRTSLSYAAQEDHPASMPIVRELVKWGADLNEIDDYGRTLLDNARVLASRAFLRELGAKTSAELRARGTGNR